MNAAQEEFGEAALLRILRESRHLDARGLLAAVTTAVQQFSAGEQSDDLTLLVAQAGLSHRVRTPPPSHLSSQQSVHLDS